MRNSKDPYVSVVMCHYSLPDDFGGHRARNQLQSRSEMMKDSLEALIANTDYPAEIIVVDNGGPNDDSSYLLDWVRGGAINTYVRNKENMHFGWAWNQGAKLATGSHICFMCNDIKPAKGWLSSTIKPLLKYPDKKYLATPLITPDKDTPKYMREPLEDGCRVNTMAGSNCMMMTQETFKALGEFSTHSIAGTHWHRRMSKKGYLVVAPPENMAEHLAHVGGFDIHKQVMVKKTLLGDEVVDYSCLRE